MDVLKGQPSYATSLTIRTYHVFVWNFIIDYSCYHQLQLFQQVNMDSKNLEVPGKIVPKRPFSRAKKTTWSKNHRANAAVGHGTPQSSSKCNKSQNCPWRSPTTCLSSSRGSSFLPRCSLPRGDCFAAFWSVPFKEGWLASFVSSFSWFVYLCIWNGDFFCKFRSLWGVVCFVCWKLLPWILLLLNGHVKKTCVEYQSKWYATLVDSRWTGQVFLEVHLIVIQKVLSSIMVQGKCTMINLRQILDPRLLDPPAPELWDFLPHYVQKWT